jgi:hypothetical protein
MRGPSDGISQLPISSSRGNRPLLANQRCEMTQGAMCSSGLVGEDITEDYCLRRFAAVTRCGG